MRSFIFIWRDAEGNNAFFQVETNSYMEAWRAFDAAHGCSVFAVIEGSHMEMREFTA
jgi:hypothetical protein